MNSEISVEDQQNLSIIEIFIKYSGSDCDDSIDVNHLNYKNQKRLFSLEKRKRNVMFVDCYGGEYLFLIKYNDNNKHYLYSIKNYKWDEFTGDIFEDWNKKNSNFTIYKMYFTNYSRLITIEKNLTTNKFMIYINDILINFIGMYSLVKIRKLYECIDLPEIKNIFNSTNHNTSINVCNECNIKYNTNGSKIKYYKQIKRILLYSDIWIKCKK